MRPISRRLMLGGSAVLAVAATLAACSNGSSSGSENGVYLLNFKPEAEEALKTIASAYKDKTGVEVKIVTAASGTYQQTLQTEVAKSNPPTIFNINGPVGLATWKDYALDLSGTEFVKALTDTSMALTDESGVAYGSPLGIEGYGLIYNAAILNKYFALEGAKATSVDEIKGFAKLKEVVEDMQARKADLGIEGAFACTSLASGEDWRWQTHLANYPVFYEFRDKGVTDAKEVDLTYSDNYKQIFDLYLNNSTVAEGDIHFMPIYIGVNGEEKSGIALGTENYLAVNSQVSETAQKASIDFLTWLLTGEGAKMLVDNSVVSVSPYPAFSELTPADPLGKETAQFLANKELYPINWVFQTFPSQEFKNQLGSHLAQYASGKEDWSAVKEYFVSTWKSEKSA